MSTTPSQPTTAPSVTVNIAQNNRMYEIVATLLFCGAIGMTAYALAQNGWLEIGATALTLFLVNLAKLLINNGLVRVPSMAGKSTEFQGTAGFLRTAAAEFATWQAKSPIWRLAGLALAYTLLFMTARWAIGVALMVFTNMWIAGAAAAVMAALIIFPQLLSNALRKMKSKQ